MGDATLHRHGDTIPGPDGPPIVPFPRKRAALSAPGGALVLSPLETPLRREGWASAPAFGNHPKDRERQRKKKQMVSSLQPDKRHTRRYEDAVIQGTSVSAAGRRLLDFVGSAYRPLLRMGELTACGQLIPNIFSFPPYTAHFLFDVSKRKWGVYSDRQSRDSVLNQQ